MRAWGAKRGQAGTVVLLCVLASGRSVDTVMEEGEGCWREAIIFAAAKDSKNDSSMACSRLSCVLSCSGTSKPL